MNTYDALASAIYMAKLQLSGDTVDTDDKRLRASGLYEDWTLGSYQVGDIRNANGQTWECHTAHDNATYPDITPDNPQTWANFWRPLHGTSPETARPWVQPQYGTTDIYKQGEYMIWTDGSTKRCIAPNGTNYSPEEYPDGWETVTAVQP